MGLKNRDDRRGVMNGGGTADNMIQVSVCLALHNGEHYIKEQLVSILSQLSPADEVIISDDGSTDQSVEIIQQMQDHRIRLIKSPQKNNLVSNFENALVHASGRYLFLSDQDDIWKPDKIQIMTALLETHDLVVCDCSIHGLRKGEIGSYFKWRNSGSGLLKNLIKNGYVGCCMAFNRSILKNALPFPENIPMHDWWIGLVAEICGTPFFCDQILVEHRRHQTNASPFETSNQYTLIDKIRLRVKMVFEIARILVMKQNR